jgi:hypothetical protein
MSFNTKELNGLKYCRNLNKQCSRKNRYGPHKILCNVNKIIRHKNKENLKKNYNEIIQYKLYTHDTITMIGKYDWYTQIPSYYVYIV